VTRARGPLVEEQPIAVAREDGATGESPVAEFRDRPATISGRRADPARCRFRLPVGPLEPQLSGGVDPTPGAGRPLAAFASRADVRNTKTEELQTFETSPPPKEASYDARASCYRPSWGWCCSSPPYSVVFPDATIQMFPTTDKPGHHAVISAHLNLRPV